MFRFIPLALVLLFLGGACDRIDKTDRPVEKHQPTIEVLKNYQRPDDSGGFRVVRPDAPWGDFGRILRHGMSAHLEREGGEGGAIRLERAGPYVPPITLPGIRDLIVTDEVKRSMESAGFRGVAVLRVTLERIVDLPCHEWDWKAPNPEFFPDDGEPETYILGREHSTELAEQMGPLWEVVATEGDWVSHDLFREGRRLGASPRAVRWFKECWPEWIEFRESSAN